MRQPSTSTPTSMDNHKLICNIEFIKRVEISLMSNPPTIEFIETLAKKAGEILRSGYGKQHEINHKGTIDLVTEIDYRSEAFILQELRTAFPEHQIITEESGAQFGSDCCLWYIDPLDGTVNYAHNIPIFSVSIAYQEGGELQLGAVCDPMRQECFSAERGKIRSKPAGDGFSLRYQNQEREQLGQSRPPGTKLARRPALGLSRSGFVLRSSRPL